MDVLNGTQNYTLEWKNKKYETLSSMDKPELEIFADKMMFVNWEWQTRKGLKSSVKYFLVQNLHTKNTVEKKFVEAIKIPLRCSENFSGGNIESNFSKRAF